MRAVLIFVVVWLIFDRTALALGSARGEYGWLVCAVVLALLALAQRWLTGGAWSELLPSLGLRKSALQPMAATVALSLALLAFFPLYAARTGVTIHWRSDALLLAAGMFLQGGIAEETLFRGFMFGHISRGRSFWRAACLAAIPFVLVHLLLFWTLDWPVALAALVLALAMSFPLAWIFQRSGASVWPGALLHAAVQAPIKLVEVEASAFAIMAMAWMALASTAPWLLFMVRGPGTSRRPGAAEVAERGPRPTA